MNKRLQDLYLEYVNDYLTVEKWSEHNGISTESGTKILDALRVEYNQYADLVGKQRTTRPTRMMLENRVKNHTREQIVSYYVDILGYSEIEMVEWDTEYLLNRLTTTQLKELSEYC